MQSTIDTIDPAEPNIYVRRSTAGISDLALCEVRCIAMAYPDSVMCQWLVRCVDDEIERRSSNDAIEPGVLFLPWHSWNDRELSGALITSYCWHDVTSQLDSQLFIEEVRRAVVTAAATRLGELHQAILLGRKGK